MRIVCVLAHSIWGIGSSCSAVLAALSFTEQGIAGPVERAWLADSSVVQAAHVRMVVWLCSADSGCLCFAKMPITGATGVLQLGDCLL
jgi:hypothetical protein